MWLSRGRHLLIPKQSANISDLYTRKARRLSPPGPSNEAWGAVLDRFQGEVLVGGRVGETGDQAKAGFADARPHAVEESELPDRREDHPLDDDLLHFVEDRCALGVIELDRLLLVERVEIGVAAIGKDAALDRERPSRVAALPNAPGPLYLLMKAARSIGRSLARMPIA